MHSNGGPARTARGPGPQSLAGKSRAARGGSVPALAELRKPA